MSRPVLTPAWPSNSAPTPQGDLWTASRPPSPPARPNRQESLPDQTPSPGLRPGTPPTSRGREGERERSGGKRALTEGAGQALELPGTGSAQAGAQSISGLGSCSSSGLTAVIVGPICDRSRIMSSPAPVPRWRLRRGADGLRLDRLRSVGSEQI